MTKLPPRDPTAEVAVFSKCCHVVLSSCWGVSRETRDKLLAFSDMVHERLAEHFCRRLLGENAVHAFGALFVRGHAFVDVCILEFTRAKATGRRAEGARQTRDSSVD